MFFTVLLKEASGQYTLDTQLRKMAQGEGREQCQTIPGYEAPVIKERQNLKTSSVLDGNCL